MLAYIKGTIEDKCSNFIVVDVNGVGYKVYTSLSTLENSPQKGDIVKLHTTLYVREDVMALYGFYSQEELGMFELLNSVSGIGPKVALNVISSLSPSKFGLAVITEDVKALTGISGIGNKTAQRIILELKDKIKNGYITDRVDASAAGIMDGYVAEAISALMVLGYTPLEARTAVEKVTNDTRDVEVVVKEALKTLIRK